MKPHRSGNENTKNNRYISCILNCLEHSPLIIRFLALLQKVRSNDFVRNLCIFLGCLEFKIKFSQIILYYIHLLLVTFIYIYDIFYCFRCLFFQLQQVEQIEGCDSQVIILISMPLDLNSLGAYYEVLKM